MSSAFNAKLQVIIDKKNPHMRSWYQERFDTLRDAGAISFESLLALAQDPTADTGVRVLACWALGWLREKRAVPALLQAFQSPEGCLRWEAADSLGYIQGKRAFKPLIAVLLHDEESDKRDAAAFTLGNLADERAIEPLLHVLNNSSEEPEVRGTAAASLGYLLQKKDYTQYQHVVAGLIAALRDPSAVVRLHSISALGFIGDPQALPELERLAATDTAVVPKWYALNKGALEAIARIKDDEAEARRLLLEEL